MNSVVTVIVESSRAYQYNIKTLHIVLRYVILKVVTF